MRYHHLILLLLCSWVLWVEHERIGVGDKNYERQWVPEAAYPEGRYEQCIQDMKTLAQRRAEGFKTGPNVKSVKLDELIGNRMSIHIELKSGGSIFNTYVCFPDTVKPE